MNTFNQELKLKAKEIKAREKQQEELNQCYELGKQAAWNNASVDSCPRYRKQNKIAAWLQGHADTEQEKQNMALSRQVDKAGIAKLKELIHKATQ